MEERTEDNMPKRNSIDVSIVLGIVELNDDGRLNKRMQTKTNRH